IRYEQLANALKVPMGGRAPLADVSRAVLELRRSKGMVLDPADHDTWSAGSFFVNPLLDLVTSAQLPPDAPRWPQVDGTVKTSAAWLIEHAGFARGYGTGQARLSSKHALAITNRGRATTNDVLALAREIRSGVRDRFRVDLVPEPILVGCDL
ncbi:MAG TPA: UDP-N-acetylenolpyruvoylglucosamine reductase, partial [Actinomycetes bacterium]|nr:UDP-N-acetylenolpyruvoylglucosamine reductase [Actinomycetes bacterium]